MASRNSDGSRKLQPEATKSARHTGDIVSIGDSDGDTVVSREGDTSYIPPSGTVRS